MSDSEYIEFRWAIRRDSDCEQNDEKISNAFEAWKSLVADLHPCFFAFEHELDHFLEKLLETQSETRNQFILKNLIRSSHLSLASRRKIVLEWLLISGDLDSKDKNQNEKWFSQVIKRRNAVIHGAPCLDKNYQLRLEYFSGDPLTVLVNREWVAETVDYCNKATDWLRELHVEN
jgi:hypothetical protein